MILVVVKITRTRDNPLDIYFTAVRFDKTYILEFLWHPTTLGKIVSIDTLDILCKIFDGLLCCDGKGDFAHRCDSRALPRARDPVPTAFWRLEIPAGFKPGNQYQVN